MPDEIDKQMRVLGLLPSSNTAKNQNFDAETGEAFKRAGAKLGINPAHIATIVGFETGGSYNPHQRGGAGNKYVGGIQFGIPEQKKYYNPNQTLGEQVEDGITRFFQDRYAEAYRKTGNAKYKSTNGASLEDLYTTVIAGNPAANRDAPDAFGTTARSGAAKMAKQHRPVALRKFFGGVEPDSDENNFDFDSFASNLLVGQQQTAATKQQIISEQKPEFDFDSFSQELLGSHSLPESKTTAPRIEKDGTIAASQDLTAPTNLPANHIQPTIVPTIPLPVENAPNAQTALALPINTPENLPPPNVRAVRQVRQPPQAKSKKLHYEGDAGEVLDLPESEWLADAQPADQNTPTAPVADPNQIDDFNQLSPARQREIIDPRHVFEFQLDGLHLTPRLLREIKLKRAEQFSKLDDEKNTQAAQSNAPLSDLLVNADTAGKRLETQKEKNLGYQIAGKQSFADTLGGQKQFGKIVEVPLNSALNGAGFQQDVIRKALSGLGYADEDVNYLIEKEGSKILINQATGKPLSSQDEIVDSADEQDLRVRDGQTFLRYRLTPDGEKYLDNIKIARLEGKTPAQVNDEISAESVADNGTFQDFDPRIKELQKKQENGEDLSTLENLELNTKIGLRNGVGGIAQNLTTAGRAFRTAVGLESETNALKENQTLLLNRENRNQIDERSQKIEELQKSGLIPQGWLQSKTGVSGGEVVRGITEGVPYVIIGGLTGGEGVLPLMLSNGALAFTQNLDKDPKQMFLQTAIAALAAGGGHAVGGAVSKIAAQKLESLTAQKIAGYAANIFSQPAIAVGSNVVTNPERYINKDGSINTANLTKDIGTDTLQALAFSVTDAKEFFSKHGNLWINSPETEYHSGVFKTEDGKYAAILSDAEHRPQAVEIPADHPLVKHAESLKDNPLAVVPVGDEQFKFLIRSNKSAEHLQSLGLNEPGRQGSVGEIGKKPDNAVSQAKQGERTAEPLNGEVEKTAAPDTLTPNERKVYDALAASGGKGLSHEEISAQTGLNLPEQTEAHFGLGDKDLVGTTGDYNSEDFRYTLKTPENEAAKVSELNDENNESGITGEADSNIPAAVPVSPEVTETPKDEGVKPSELTGVFKGMAGAMSENLKSDLWNKLQNNDVTELGKKSNILLIAKKIRDNGGLQTKAEFDAFTNDFGKTAANQTGNELTKAANDLFDKYKPSAPNAESASMKVPLDVAPLKIGDRVQFNDPNEGKVREGVVAKDWGEGANGGRNLEVHFDEKDSRGYNQRLFAPNEIEKIEPVKEATNEQVADVSQKMPESSADEGKMNSQAGAINADLLTLGLNKTYEQDVKPAIKDVYEGLKQTRDDIKKVFFAGNRGESAEIGAGIMRHRLAQSARAYDQAKAALDTTRKYFAGRKAEDNYKFIDAIEEGRINSLSAEERPLALEMRKILNDARQKVQELGTGKLENFNENYFPHIWDKNADVKSDPNAPAKTLEGSKAFLKQRTIRSFKEGRKLGLTPVSENPVDFVVLKTREMNRYIAAQEAITDMRKQGLVKMVRENADAPEGFVKIDDKISKVYEVNQQGANVLAGYYYAAEPVATIINNHLAAGLQGKFLYDKARQSANLLNQAQLGISAFHAVFSGINASVSKLSQGFSEVGTLRPVRGLKSVAETPIAAISSVVKGDRLLKAWLDPKNADPVYRAVADALEKAGGRAKMDDFYQTSAARKMLDAFKQGNLVGGAFRAPSAILDVVNKPVMEYLVPRLKLGAFYDLAKSEIGRMDKDATPEQVKAALGNLWDSVDNRFGQLVYDNLFWNKTAKDAAMITTRAVGWNLGFFREGIGGFKDTATAPVRAYKQIRQGLSNDKGVIKTIQSAPKPIVTQRMAYVAALPVLHGIVGSVLNYLMTGEKPQDLEDAFFPRTGEVDENGKPVRISIPTYMKDAYAYYKHPARTLAHKANPLINLSIEMLQNKDFYGTEIRNEDDPIVRQFLDSAKHVGDSFMPMSVRNAQKSAESKDSTVKKVGNFLGFTRAPADVDKTKAEELLGDIRGENALQKSLSKEEKLKQDTIRDLVREQKRGNNISEEFDKAVAAGILKRDDRRLIRERASTNYLEGGVSALSIDDALKVVGAATGEEKTRLQKTIKEKADNLNKARTLTEENVKDIQKYYPDFKVEIKPERNISERLKSASVGEAANLYADREDKMDDTQKRAFKEQLRRKLLMANRAGTLTQEEFDKAKEILPDINIKLRPARPQRKQRSRTPSLDSLN